MVKDPRSYRVVHVVVGQPRDVVDPGRVPTQRVVHHVRVVVGSQECIQARVLITRVPILHLRGDCLVEQGEVSDGQVDVVRVTPEAVSHVVYAILNLRMLFLTFI